MTDIAEMHEALIYRWSDRVLAFNQTFALSPHRHGAAELVVSLDQPFVCNLADGAKIETTSLLIPPNVQHQNQH